jgi:ABC-type phosphate/phosphonate transport system permease subunit
MQRLTSLLSRILFIVAFVLAGLAVWERLAQWSGYTLLRGVYDPWRLMEYSVVALLFVVALQLREIKLEQRGRGTK